MWVQELRYGYVKHDCHANFAGKPIYMSVLARNEDGTPKLKKILVTNKVAGHKIYYNGEDQPFSYAFDYMEAFMAERKGYHVETMYKTGWEETRYYTKVLIGHYTNNCTDELVRHNATIRPRKWYSEETTRCYIRLPKTMWSKWNRPRKDERRNHHKSGRQQETNTLTQYRNLYNSGTNLEDVDLIDVDTRPRQHEGWWD